MAVPTFAPRVLESSSTTGTGSFTLTGAQTGDQSFVVGCVNGAIVDYFAFDSTGAWEEGQGTLSSSNTVLSRTVYKSSNSNNAVSWTASQNLRVGVTISSNFMGTVLNTGATVTVAQGGTGAATLASNGVLYGNGTNAIQALAVNSSATNKFLTQSSSGAPAWATIVAGDVPTLNQNTSGSSASCTGNAATATKWASAVTVWGASLDGSGNVTGSLTAVGDITGGASNMTITAGTGNSRTLTLRSTTSGGNATAFLTGNADQSSTFGGNISGTVAWTLTGGAGNMTVVSGTGNSRTMILQTTTSGGVATTALTLGADQSGTFAGDLISTRLQVGSTAIPTATQYAQLSGTLTATSGTIMGVALTNTLSPATDSSCQFRVMSISNQFSASGVAFTSVIGAAPRALYTENRIIAAGQITSVVGAYTAGVVIPSSGAGTITGITEIVGSYVQPFISLSAQSFTVSNAFGFRVVDSSLNGVTLTSQAAFCASAITSATNNTYLLLGTATIPSGSWAIYSASASASSFLGSLSLGTNTAPTATLSIAEKTLVNSSGLVTKYNNISTSGTGVPPVYAAGRSTGRTAAVASVSTYTLPATDGSFEVSANVNVTTSTLHNFTVTCAYTDEGNTARTLTIGFTQLSGATLLTAITNATGAGPYESPVVHIRCKASTAITIATTGTFTTVTYNVEGIIKQTA